MKKIISSMLGVLLSLIALSAALSVAAAAELKPVLVASFSSYSDLMSDINLIGKLGGKPEFDTALEGMIAMITQGKGLAGVDQKQPLGTVVLSDGSDEFTSYGFLPVTDFSQVMELVKNPMTGESPKAENGVYEIPLGMQSIYAVQKGNWAYVSQKKETLDNVAADPTILLGDLPKRYLLAVRVSVSNVPDSVKESYLASMTMAMRIAAQLDEDESEEQKAARATMLKQNIDQLQMFSKQLDDILVGLKIDGQANTASLDLELTAKPGTMLADHLAMAKPGKSDLAGLKLDGTAVTLNVVNQLTDDDVARREKLLAGSALFRPKRN